jgi:hypothetical protein
MPKRDTQGREEGGGGGWSRERDRGKEGRTVEGIGSSVLALLRGANKKRLFVSTPNYVSISIINSILWSHTHTPQFPASSSSIGAHNHGV